MQLNPDCIRDILLSIEDVVNFDTLFRYDSSNVNSKLSSYSHDQILYHVRQAYLAGLVTEPIFYDIGSTFDVADLTPKGHEFLANIRKDTIWNNTKEVAKKIGVSSLSSLTTIASNVISEIIKAQFKLNA